MLLIILPFLGNGQVQALGIPFQGVAKDFSGNLVNQRVIYIDVDIVSKDQPTIVLMNELHKAKTDDWGLFSLLIGKGKFLGGKYDQLFKIDWSIGKYQLQIKMAIEPEAPLPNWDYKQHLIALGATDFGIVPYALYSAASGGVDGSLNDKLALKLNTIDTTLMLSPYIKKVATFDKTSIDTLLSKKISIQDSGLRFVTPSQLNAKTFDTLSISNRIEARVKFSDTVQLSNRINERIKFSDTIYLSNRIEDRIKFSDTIYLSNRIEDRVKLSDTIYLSNRINDRIRFSDTVYLSNRINQRLNFSDTVYLSNRINAKFNLGDTVYLSNRVALRELISNKSIDLTAIADYSNQKYPTVKATKDYVDNQVSAIGIPDASITDAKIATGIQASKVGLSNVTNHAQLYNMNGLTAQVQDFANPGAAGLAPNWISVGSTHTLNLPMASSSAVTAGLISKSEFDHFNTAYTSSLNVLTTNGSSGAAVLSGQSLNIPNYTILGLSGLVNPNFILAGPSSGVAGSVQYRALVAADIPNHASNTTGNAATASKLETARSFNSVSFDGTQDIVLKATTTNKLQFSVGGMGANGTEYFDGSSSKNISYNTVGAAPKIGSADIATLGTITSGTWNGDVIGATVGGAGAVNGLLKANGVGLVTAASSVTDYQQPLSFTTPLLNTSNTISLLQANTNAAGYLSSTDWNIFNNKISASEKAAANGVATLNASGKIPTSQIPAISFSSGYVVSSQSQMLALSAAVVGSIAIRTDNSKNYVLSASDPSVLANWLELLMPAAVSSVNGYTTGSIVLTSSDIAEGTNLYFSNARVRTAVDAFLLGDAPLSYNTSTGKLSITQANTTANGYLSATDWNTFSNKQNTFASQLANTFYAAPNGLAGTPSFRTLVSSDIPLLNQNTTGNAATTTALLNPRTINGISFNGTADITIPSNTSNAITFNNSGTGAVSTTSFNGSTPISISYNSIGALPTFGATTITTIGTISSGTWNANVIGSNYGGAGTVNGLLKANGSGLVSAATVGTDYESPLSFSAPMVRSSNAITIASATSGNSGILTASDWQLFNNKQTTIAAGSGISITGGNTVNIGQNLSTTSINTNTFTATSINAGTLNASSNITSNGDITAKRFKLTMPTAIAALASTNLDLSTGNVFTVNLTNSITSFTTSNPAVGTYLIKLLQTVGSKTVAFPATWKWAGGVIPTLTTTLNKLDIVTLIYDGTSYYATIVQNF